MTDAPATEAPDTPGNDRIVYLGRLFRDGKTYFRFAPLAEVERQLRITMFKPDFGRFMSLFATGKTGTALVVGGIYSDRDGRKFPRTAEGRVESIAFGKIQREGRIASDDQLAAWEAEDRVAGVQRDAHAKEKKLAESPGLKAELDRLRNVYKKTSPGSRKAVLLMMINHITGD